MFRLIKQHDITDCGAACLSMVCNHYGLKLPLAEFRELIQVDNAGSNIYGIVKGAEKVNLKAEALEGDELELVESIKRKEFCFPFIAHVIINDSLEHYVVVYKTTNKYFCVADPASGKSTYTYDEFFSIWTGHIITFEPNKKFKKRKNNSNYIKTFITLINQQKKILLSTLLISVFITAISIAGAFLLQIVVDGLNNDMFGFCLKNSLSPLCIGIILLYFLRSGLSVLRSFFLCKLSVNIDNALMMKFYSHIMKIPVKNILTRETGDIITRFSDISNIRNTLSSTILSLVLDTMMIVCSCVILYLLNHSLFYLILIFIVLYVIISICFFSPNKKINQKIMESNSEVISYLKESVDGIETIKSYGAEENTIHKTEGKVDKMLKLFFKGSMVFTIQNALSVFLTSSGTVVLLWQGSTLVENGLISVGVLLTFYTLFSYFLSSVNNLVELQPEIQNALVATERLHDLLDVSIENGNIGEGDFTKDIRINNLDFRYGYRELTLKNINLEIKKGTCVALVGESGSGKTTIAKLLMAFYQPEKGNIMIGDCALLDLNPEYVRQHIVYVPQNTFLFSDTIKNNLLIGNTHATITDIEEACKQSKADSFIKELPMGYDTLIGENGAVLSGGQRQRLAIARALLRKPDILILDEATSNLDTITENSIKETICNLSGKITCIIIAHRLNTVKNCDFIYVLDKGEIKESGTHIYLMNQKGLYYNFFCEN